MAYQIQNVEIGGEQPFFILGPCSLESEDFAWEMARGIKDICGRLNLPFIFKASYDKANRTSVDSFRGPGLEEGLEILAEIRQTFGVPVLTDVHEPWQCARAAAACTPSWSSAG